MLKIFFEKYLSKVLYFPNVSLISSHSWNPANPPNSFKAITNSGLSYGSGYVFLFWAFALLNNISAFSLSGWIWSERHLSIDKI